MANNDDLDRWLDQQITPLPPPDGTFDLIKRRARGRKMRKLAVTVTAAAAVVAAAVVIPRVTILKITSPGTNGVVAGNASGGATRSPSAQAEGTGTPEASPSSSPATVSAPVPGNFQPSSVTYIGVHTGWVIGQAGTPGHCATQYCTSIARTDNAGQTWSGVPAPLTGAASGSTGVSQIRFLNNLDGWAFGPELWATHDGGRIWTRIPTNGQRVIDLETAGTTAIAVLGTCAGTGSDYASDCTSYMLERTQASDDDWTQFGGQLTGGTGAVQLSLTSSKGFLIGPGGTLYSGPLTGTWQKAGNAPCSPASPLFGAENAATLVIACPSQHEVYGSVDGGATWHVSTNYPASASVASVAVSPIAALMLATTSGILVYNGTNWQQATLNDTAPAGGFSFVGMTTATQGVALPADTSLHEIWMTVDGGMTWQAYPVAS
jgi:photosystem II stability/assembly factor-like uncharacterized protein